MDARRLSRYAAWGVTALAAGLGLALFGLGVKAQILRLVLYERHGLGFADPFCTTGYCDFGMFWLAGGLARHGEAALLYDHARYAALAAQLLPYKTGWWPFVYPPTMLVPGWAVAALPFVAGYYGFVAVQALLAGGLLLAAGLPGWCLAGLLLSFSGMWTMYLGQLGILCGALLIYGLAQVEAKPLRAGAVLGLLAVKPQYALLVPVVALAARRWRALAAGVLVLGVMLALSWLCGGAPAWRAYLGPGRVAMRGLLERPFPGSYEAMGSSVFWMLRSLHFGLGPAYLGQGVVSLCCAVLSWRLWRAGAANRLPAAVFMSLLASPYGFTGDMAMACAMLPLLARRGAPWRNAALAWLFVAPALVPGFVAHIGFLPTPLLLLAGLWLSQAPQNEREAIGRGTLINA